MLRAIVSEQHVGSVFKPENNGQIQENATL